MNINDKGRDCAATAMTDNELDNVVGGHADPNGCIRPLPFPLIGGIGPFWGNTVTKERLP